MSDPNEAAWLESVRLHVYNLLQPIMPNAETHNLFVGPKASVIWAKAFTHETWSPGFDYEELEYLGDNVLALTFAVYLMKSFPRYTKAEYTELNVAYMSKLLQAELARNMGLGNYVRVLGIERSNLNIDADLFESFFGALFQVADLVLGGGTGYVYCNNMLIHIFKDVEIDVSRGKGSYKTQVIQIFTRFGLTPPVQQDRELQGYIEVTLTLGEREIEFLRNYGVEIPPLLARATGRTAKGASVEAYAQALRLLSSHGIDTEWAEGAKAHLDFSDPEIQVYVPAAQEKLRAEGYSNMYFRVPHKTATVQGAIVQLVGVNDETGESRTLSFAIATDKENSFHSGKVASIRNYVEGTGPR